VAVLGVAAQLWLGGNKFGDADACAFAEVLATNSALQTLGLENNRWIGDASATAFAKMLAANHALTHVCLANWRGWMASRPV